MMNGVILAVIMTTKSTAGNCCGTVMTMRAKAISMLPAQQMTSESQHEKYVLVTVPVQSGC